MSPKETKVIIAAGGTGGHIFPGIAIAEEIRRTYPSAHISFVGTSRGLESRILPPLGWPLILLGSESIKDKRGIGRLLAWIRVPFSITRATLILLSWRPRLVISIGGYAAGPLVVAAWMLRIPVTLVEPNAIAGMTNRMLGRFANKVFIGFEDSKTFFAKKKTILSGPPIRKEVLEVKRVRPTTGSSPTIFVFGGSQGAMTLNNAMRDAAQALSSIGGIKVIHQTGRNAVSAEIAAAYRTAGVEAEVIPFCDRIWECYERADLIIARAGANTVAEIAALGIPSILVPYPYAADDHQRANAKALVNAGGALLIDDSECSGITIAREIARALSDPEKLKSMGAAAASMGRPDAAAKIAKESMSLIH